MGEKKESLHGGDLYKASKIYGFKKEEFLDYSANINPLGIPEALKEILISSMDNLVNYPDPECGELKNNISDYLKVKGENIIIGNGASEIIFLLFQVLKPSRVIIPAPSFSEYPEAAIRYGADVDYYELKEREEFNFNINSFISHISESTLKADAIMLCNPNNPTSRLIAKEELFRLMEYSEEKGIFVILDEAFIELTKAGNQNSMTEYISTFKNLFIIRAFTKVFAVPGLRLGYGLGNEDIVKRMWENKIPWSVNSLAASIGGILRDTGYFERTSSWFCEERDWFYNELKRFVEFKVYKPDTNFILIRLQEKHFTSRLMKDLMASKGILIRDASNFAFLDDRFIRVAIKDRISNIKFLKAVKEVLKNN